MRLILFLHILLVFSYTTFGQTYSAHRELKTIMQQRTIYLNGGARASVGGKSRTTIPIQLPESTVACYYSFSTSPGASGTDNLNLFAQLSGNLIDATGVTRAVLSQIEVPAGSASIDVYILDHANAEAFLNKVDNNGGTFYYNSNASVSNTRQAVVHVNNISGREFYIGLRNPSTLDGINITIEVVAEVATKVYEDIWTAQNIDRIYNNCLQQFVIKDSKSNQICECYKSKLVKEYTPSVYSNLSEVDQNSIYSNTIKSCASESGHASTIDREERIRSTLELLRGQSVTKDYAGQEKSLLELVVLGFDNYQIYNSLGFCQLCLKKYDEAKKNLTIGLGKKPTDLFLLGNLGNYYLLTNQYSQAFEIFNEYKNKKLEDKRRLKEAVSDDLKEFERLGVNNDGFTRLRTELRID